MVPFVPVTFAVGPYDPAVTPDVASLSADRVPLEILLAFKAVIAEPSPLKADAFTTLGKDAF